jgi:hypothetical protein
LLLKVYAKSPDAYRQAHERFGDPQGLLRSAATAIKQAGTHDRGEGPGSSGDHEAQILIRFAVSNGLVLDSAGIARFMNDHSMRSGSEHKVAHLTPANRVIKDLDSQSIATESLFDYLTDHLLSNYFFDDDVRLEGFYEDHGRIHILISQPYVHGIHPDWETLKSGLEQQGLRHESPSSNIPNFLIEGTQAGTICVYDLHENNVILGSVSRLMHPIDAHFYFNDRAARIGALQALGILGEAK